MSNDMPLEQFEKIEVQHRNLFHAFVGRCTFKHGYTQTLTQQQLVASYLECQTRVSTAWEPELLEGS